MAMTETGEKAETYPCKFESRCKSTGMFHRSNYPCLHGGGVSCKTWCQLTDESICHNETLRRRAQKAGRHNY